MGSDQDNRPAVISPTWWILAVVFVAIVVGIVAMALVDRSGERGKPLGERFEYQIGQYRKIDPALIRWQQKAVFDIRLRQGRAIAVGPEDRVYVAGPQAVYVLEPDGKLKSQIALDSAPNCLAVGGVGHAAAGRIYVGLKDRVELWNPDGTPAGAWESLGPKAVLTSIALGRKDVCVADAGSQMVYRFDTSGKQLGRIGERDQEHNTGGFAVPSPFFDVAVSPGGTVYVVNPGALRIQSYTADGKLQLFWGKSSAEIDGFFGCCNPAHMALLPDGRIVTAEKGLLRVKVYSAEGTLDSVVAGPELLDSPAAAVASQSLTDREYTAVDVAADSRGRILVLDRATGSVRVFEEKPGSKETGNAPAR